MTKGSLILNRVDYSNGGMYTSTQVNMADKASGGVDITIGNTTKTVATESEVTELSGDLSHLQTTVEHHTNLIDELFKDSFDGTERTYKKLMREWFLDNGAETATPAELTALVNEWYLHSRVGWSGGTTFSQPNISTSSEGTKIGDNADMVCVPSTDTVANRDDYAGLPLFAVTTVNWELDANGKKLITAIKGITSNFEQSNPEKYVGVVQQTAYIKTGSDDTTYSFYYADSPLEGYKPLPEAINLDGTVDNFVLHGKYMSATINGKMTCCSGQIPTAFNSCNSLVPLSNANGDRYSAGSVVDWSFLVWMTIIKYGSMTQDGRIQGCCNYNYQYNASVAESNVNRVILTTAQGNNLIVGSSVIIGEGASNIDRGSASARSISNGCKITSIEDVEINGTTYKAVYVDASNFSATTSTVISTWHWASGTNDNVLGNDGSIVSASNGKYPAIIQGIEYAVGGYEVFGDVILYLTGENYIPYVRKDATKKVQNATITSSGYIDSGLRSAQYSTANWFYINKLNYNGEIFFGDTENGASNKYTKDAFYKNNTNTKSVHGEWLAFGYLSPGSGLAGLSCLYGSYTLGIAVWYCLARLSPNGNRGTYN